MLTKRQMFDFPAMTGPSYHSTDLAFFRAISAPAAAAASSSSAVSAARNRACVKGAEPVQTAGELAANFLKIYDKHKRLNAAAKYDRLKKRSIFVLWRQNGSQSSWYFCLFGYSRRRRHSSLLECFTQGGLLCSNNNNTCLEIPAVRTYRDVASASRQGRH